MDEYVLRLNKISKRYKSINVFDGIDLSIKKGQIYGLIGLNGAGKSTLMKIITGLTASDSGTIELFHEHEKSKIEAARKRIGALVESPALYINKTVYENMNINRIQKGIPGEDCIEKTLAMVELNDKKHLRVKNLSLGAKQLLGLAMAILGEPEFLILDEPINGLDPIKIIKIRELLKKLNSEYKTTMLISSHILGELYNVATNFGIIHNGKLIEELTTDELDKKCRKFLHIKVDSAAKAAVIINNKLKTSDFNVLADNVINLYSYTENSGKVNETLVKEGITVEQIMPMGENLEAYFAKTIGAYRDV